MKSHVTEMLFFLMEHFIFPVKFKTINDYPFTSFLNKLSFFFFEWGFKWSY